MKTIETDTRTLAPWADVLGILSNAKTLTVKAGKKRHSGLANLAIDDHGNVVLEFKK